MQELVQVCFFLRMLHFEGNEKRSKASRMFRHLTLTLSLLALATCASGADYFQWILEVFPEGVYRNSERQQVDENTEFQARGWVCTVENAWQSNGAWLLLEGKSLICRKSGGSVEKRLDLVCTDHDPTIRKRSRPMQRAGLHLDETRPESAPFLRLGCQTVVRRLY